MIGWWRRRRDARDRALIDAALEWWDFDGSLGTSLQPIEYPFIVACAEDTLSEQPRRRWPR